MKYFFQDFDCHRIETLTLSKYVAEYKHKRKLVVNFFRKCWGRAIEINGVNTIRVAKQFIFFNILHAIPPQVTSS